MNKAEMADRLAARTGLSMAVAKDAVDGAFAAIGDVFANGEEVQITGFRILGTRAHQLIPHATGGPARPS